MDPESTLLVFKDEEVGRKNSGFGTFNVGAEMEITPCIGVEFCYTQAICLDPQIPVSIHVCGEDFTGTHLGECLPVVELHTPVVGIVDCKTTTGRDKRDLLR